MNVLMTLFINTIHQSSKCLSNLNLMVADNSSIEETEVKVERSNWNAREPTTVTPLQKSVPYVVIHNSFIPPMCNNQYECAYAMRTMQNMHMDDKKWADIAYNFAIGGDGQVYRGRGWGNKGAHVIKFNEQSIGVCFIGNFTETSPPPNMVEATRRLIAEGARLGYLARDYKVVAHSQIRKTNCPGNALFEEVKKMKGFESNPKIA